MVVLPFFFHTLHDTRAKTGGRGHALSHHCSVRRIRHAVISAGITGSIVIGSSCAYLIPISRHWKSQDAGKWPSALDVVAQMSSMSQALAPSSAAWSTRSVGVPTLYDSDMFLLDNICSFQALQAAWIFPALVDSTWAVLAGVLRLLVGAWRPGTASCTSTLGLAAAHVVLAGSGMARPKNS